MLRLVPTHWFSWDFRLEDASGLPSAEVILSSWRERGAVVAGGTQYRISRQGFAGPFVLENAGAELARGVKVSAFRKEFAVSHGAVQYTLRPVSAWRREFEVFGGDGGRIGGIAPESWWTRRAVVNLPESMPLWLQAFCVWLVALMWKRDADSAAAASS